MYTEAGAHANAPAGSRARGTSMGGLYVAATLQALVTNQTFPQSDEQKHDSSPV